MLAPLFLPPNRGVEKKKKKGREFRGPNRPLAVLPPPHLCWGKGKKRRKIRPTVDRAVPGSNLPKTRGEKKGGRKWLEGRTCIPAIGFLRYWLRFPAGGGKKEKGGGGDPVRPFPDRSRNNSPFSPGQPGPGKKKEKKGGRRNRERFKAAARPFVA